MWFRVNELLPLELQKDLPDGSSPASAAHTHSPTSNVHSEESQKRSPAMPRRSPPPPPSREQTHNSLSHSAKEVQHSRPGHGTLKVGGAEGSLGAFWSTQHAHDSQVTEDKGPVFDDEPIGQATLKSSQANPERRKGVHGNTLRSNGPNEDFEIRFSPEKKQLPTEKPTFQNEAFNAFVADFNTATSANKNSKSIKEEELEAEVIRLREQLKQANLEKAEITSKYEKLSAICRSQRQELQELKRSLTASTSSSSSKESPKTPETVQREKIEGTVWELQQGMVESSPSSTDSKQWQAFAEEPKQQTATPRSVNSRSVRTTNGLRNTMKQQGATTSTGDWGFGQDSFKAAPSGGPEISRIPAGGSTSQRFGVNEVKKADGSQPAGWAGF